jgi:hypothetical protein
VKEAAETRRTTRELLQETKDIAKAIKSMPSHKTSYASVLLLNAEMVTLDDEDHEKSRT